MRNIRIIIEYDGTNYVGWQRQRGLLTVQGALEDALRRLTCAPPDKEVKVNGASRTDAGVHAISQVGNFLTQSLSPARAMMNGLNFFTPDDIVIKEADDVPLDFDPRRHSKSKTYLYRIINHAHPSAILRNFSWHVFQPLNVPRMREAAVDILGEKDFTSFCSAESDAEHAVREVTSFEIFERGNGIIEFEVKGRAFLRHMVRIMAGTVVAVGKGRLKPTDIKRIIAAKDRRRAAITAPPQGLFLVKVEY